MLGIIVIILVVIGVSLLFTLKYKRRKINFDEDVSQNDVYSIDRVENIKKRYLETMEIKNYKTAGKKDVEEFYKSQSENLNNII